MTPVINISFFGVAYVNIASVIIITWHLCCCCIGTVQSYELELLPTLKLKLIQDMCPDIRFNPEITFRKSKYGGIGVFALTALEPQTILMQIPYKCTLSAENIIAQFSALPFSSQLQVSADTYLSLFANRTTEEVGIALYLTELKINAHHAHEGGGGGEGEGDSASAKTKGKARKLFFSEYLDVFPVTLPNIPLVWNKPRIALIKQTRAYQITLTQFQRIAERMQFYGLSAAVHPYFQYLLYSFAMVVSRIFTINGQNLLPFGADIFNHGPKAAKVNALLVHSAEFGRTGAGVSASASASDGGEYLTITSTRAIAKDKECLLDYGLKSNSYYLAYYGFLNHQDELQYRFTESDIMLDQSDPNFVFKKYLLNYGKYINPECGLRLLPTLRVFDGFCFNLASLQSYYIASLPEELFDAYHIAQIMAVEYSVAQHILVANPDGDRTSLSGHQSDDQGVNRNALRYMVHQLTRHASAENTAVFKMIGAHLEDSICQRTQVLVSKFFENWKNAKKTQNVDDETLHLIKRYIKREVQRVQSCVRLFCVDAKF